MSQNGEFYPKVEKVFAFQVFEDNITDSSNWPDWFKNNKNISVSYVEYMMGINNSTPHLRLLTPFRDYKVFPNDWIISDINTGPDHIFVLKDKEFNNRYVSKIEFGL